MKRQKGRIYGETTDEFGFPLDGTDYQAHIKDAGPGIFIAPGGEVRTIEAVLFSFPSFHPQTDLHLDEDILPPELRSKQLPKAVNLKYGR